MALKYGTGDLESFDNIVKETREQREARQADFQHDCERFVRVYMRAISGGGNISNVATELGMTAETVAFRAKYLRTVGVPLPYFARKKALDVSRIISAMKDA